MKPAFYLFHDPMCSWCWGYRPVSDRLWQALPDTVIGRKVVGGLAPDSDAPMSPALLQNIPRTWQRIHALLGTEFNFDFWTKCKPRRSTYPACRAVLAAEEQGRYDDMVDAIQRAYYLRAMNPSDLETLQTLADELGLDGARFADDIRSVRIEERLESQVELARRAPIDGFPSLVLDEGGKMTPVTRDYKNHQPTLDHLERLLSRAEAAGSPMRRA
jgi:putative protein-disulfide isomerase